MNAFFNAASLLFSSQFVVTDTTIKYENNIKLII